MKINWVLLLVAVIIVSLPVIAGAQRPGSDYQLFDTKGKAYQGPGFVNGVVSTITEKQISLGGNHVFPITQQTKIFAGGKEIQWNYIKSGDAVLITFLFPQMVAVKIEKK